MSGETVRRWANIAVEPTRDASSLVQDRAGAWVRYSDVLPLLEAARNLVRDTHVIGEEIAIPPRLAFIKALAAVLEKFS